MTTPITVDSLRDRIAEAIAENVKACNIPAVCVGLGIQDSVGEHDLNDPNIAKTQLYSRLKESVCGAQSPGEYAIFHTYYKRYGNRLGDDKLPVLLPQVYLHYDPYTKRERGDEKFLERQRMDFLIMLEGGVRIIIEVDGNHHYGTPDPSFPERYLVKHRIMQGWWQKIEDSD